jgi:SAM-dependent methyltransferase
MPCGERSASRTTAETVKALTYTDLEDYYDEHDLILFLSLDAVRKMKGDRVCALADEILSFLCRRGVEDPFRRYADRVKTLQTLQQSFEKTGRYPASCYAEVQPVDLEEYNLALLLSFVVTNHRFEILEWLADFLAWPVDGPQRLLSVGFGTGYELKLARGQCPAWELEAFDRSPDVARYAADLLAHFGCDASCLRLEEFPLEREEGIGAYESRYGKVVLCEVLEHLEQPARAIRNLGSTLAPGGHMFLTMAINLAQEDHIHLYRSPDEARRQVLAAGLEIEREWVTPVTARAFAEGDRAKGFADGSQKGNYVCVARRGSGPR